MKERDSPSTWQQGREEALKGPITIHTGDTADAAKIGKAAKIHAGNCAVPAAAGASCATPGDAVAPAKGCSGCDRRGRDADEDTAVRRPRPSYSLAPLPAIPKVFLRGRPVPWTPRGKGLSAEKEKSIREAAGAGGKEPLEVSQAGSKVLVGATGPERVERVENREAQANSGENEPKFDMQEGFADSEVETAAGRSAKVCPK